METQETINEIDTNFLSQKPKTSRLAVWSMVFAILGPFCFGLMWMVSFLSFRELIKVCPYSMTFFSCVVAWILGLILGIKSLGQIENSHGQLAGKEYAIMGIAISMAWALFLFGGLFLPLLFYVNS